MTISEFIQKLVELGAPMEAALFAAREMEQKQKALDEEISTKRERWRRHKNNQRKRVSSGQSAGTSSGMSTDVHEDKLDLSPSNGSPPPVYSNNKYPPSLTPSLGRAKSATRGTRLANDWLPDLKGDQMGRETFGAKLANELEAFRDYWAAQPGQKGIKTDWQATWRNWCRRAGERVNVTPFPFKARERDLRNVPDYQLSNDEYWRKRLQLREGK